MTNITLLNQTIFKFPIGREKDKTFIFPPTGHYGRREFIDSQQQLWAAESEFSDLIGFHRIL